MSIDEAMDPAATPEAVPEPAPAKSEPKKKSAPKKKAAPKKAAPKKAAGERALAAVARREVARTETILAGRLDDHRRACDVARLFYQLADATRIKVFLMLREGRPTVGEIATRLGVSQPGLSHHLAILRNSGIVWPERAGKTNHYTLTEEGRKLGDLVAQIY